MSYDVFISYSRKDAAIAEEILNALESSGIQCFIDRTGISGGADFPAVLAEAILESRLVLLLASEHSYKSEYTRKELVFTVNNRGSQCLFPLIIDGSPLPKDLEFMLSNINYRTLSDRYTIGDLSEDIRRRLDGKDRTTPLVFQGHRGRSSRLFRPALYLMAALLLIAGGGFFIRQQMGESRLRHQAGQAQALYGSCLDSAAVFFVRADSIRALYRPEEYFNQEWNALKQVLRYLDEADSVRISAQDNPYVQWQRERYESLRNEYMNQRDSLSSVWKPYALSNWKVWRNSGDPVDGEIARQSIANALALHPDDPDLMQLTQ